MFLDFFVVAGVIAGTSIGLWVLISPFFRTDANQFFAYTTLELVAITLFGWLETDSQFLLFLSGLMWEYLFPVTLFIYFVKSLKIPLGFNPTLLFIPFGISTVVHIAWALDFKFHMFDLPITKRDTYVDIYDTLEYNLAFLFNVVMAVWSYVLISMDTKSPIVKRVWMKRLAVFIMLLLLAWFVLEYIEMLFGMDFWMVLWLGLSAFFLWIGYYGMYKSRLQEQKEEIHDLLSKKKSPNEGQHISSENQHIQRFENLMLQEELYKDADLSRDKVAEILGISGGHFSQLVNVRFEMSFVDVVNSYRVEAAKSMLSDEKFHKYSIQAIGLEAGFKSRSAFYSTFQKFTQQTPGAFKEATFKS